MATYKTDTAYNQFLHLYRLYMKHNLQAQHDLQPKTLYTAW